MWEGFDFSIKDKLSEFKGTLGTGVSAISSKAREIISGNGKVHPRAPKVAQSVRIGSAIYQLTDVIATGAFGTVYMARSGNGQQFAMKRVLCADEQRLREVLQEVKMTQSLPKSEHLVATYGGQISEDGNGNRLVYVLMELCERQTAFDIVAKHLDSQVPEAQIIPILRALAQALTALHSAGFAHRDVKLENLLRGRDGKWKLCDFGSCTREQFDFARIPRSQYDMVVQQLQSKTTPMYRPPQIVDPFKKWAVDKRVDLWMVGCVAYTLAYSRHPFVQASQVGIVQARVNFPPGRTPKLVNLIRNLLTPDPAKRLTLYELLTYLTAWEHLSDLPLNPDAAFRASQELPQVDSSNAFSQQPQDRGYVFAKHPVPKKAPDTTWASWGQTSEKSQTVQSKSTTGFQDVWNVAGSSSSVGAAKKGDWPDVWGQEKKGDKAWDSQWRSKEKAESDSLLQFFSSGGSAKTKGRECEDLL